MRWGREEHKPKQREKEKEKQQPLEKKQPEKQGKQQHQQLVQPQPPQQQQQNKKQREQLSRPQNDHHHRPHLQQDKEDRRQDNEDRQQDREGRHHHQHQRQQDKEDRQQDKEGRHLHQHQRHQDKEGRSSSSTPFSLFAPSSWISKLKHTLHSSKNTTTKHQLHPIPNRNNQHHLNSPDPRIKPNKSDDAQPNSDHRRKLDKSAGHRPTTVGSPPPALSRPHQVQPLSPTHPARTSSVSDHYISFLPADLDEGVFFPGRRSYDRIPGGGANGLYEANGERGGMEGRRPGMSFDPFGSSSRAEAATPAVPELRRSESAKLTRIASDLTTASTTRSSPQYIRTDHKPAATAGANTRDEEFSLFSAVPDTIRRINTTTPASAPQSSMSTATAPAAPRGSGPAAHQVPEPRRKSFSSSTGGTAGHRLRRKSKLRVHSPRVGAGATKKKAAAEVAEKLVQGKTPTEAVGKTTTTTAPSIQLESFAVVKCSSDPRRDFRDSMLEMISELGMARPDQLEGLLACYLSLNADEYHDVIVRVFRQVWLDLILLDSCTSPPHPHQRASA